MSTSSAPPETEDLEAVLQEVADQVRSAAEDGTVADYIPVLADADPSSFALVLSCLDGREFAVGDADQPFPIQSISKVLSLVLAARKSEATDGSGVADALWGRLGREPSGDPFNSLVQLEHERGIPRNPMINAGALVVDDILLDHCDDVPGDTLQLVERLVGEPVSFDEEVRNAERGTSHRNRALANLMADFDNLNHTVDEVLESYVAACALSLSTRQLARAFRFLANDGCDPGTGERILSASFARRCAAIMLTCGTYDAAGEFAYSVGLPCKSGVAGGIVALVPGWATIAVWSPPLDRTGNSVAGRLALDELAARLDLSIF
ncbi:MAG: glutaminase [Nitriliruptoraceae bacterium]|nr:glutaminase [Nitriliruptoraceae bacterium]